MPAAQYDLLIEQGATFEQEFIWKDSTGTPIDLSTYTARMKIRQLKTDTEIVSLTSSSGITLTSGGSITILISATATAALPTCRARYDLELQDALGTVTRLLQGDVEISAEVTR
jgi:hypothetical protein